MRKLVRTFVNSFLPIMVFGTPVDADPSLLLFHSFDGPIDHLDYSLHPVRVVPTGFVSSTEVSFSGRAVLIPSEDTSLQLEFTPPADPSGWTLFVINVLVDKEAMTTLDRPFLDLFDQDGRRLLTINLSGDVTVFDGEGGVIGTLSCFDALYWIGGEAIPLAITYEPDGAEGRAPRGRLTAYWSARPYGCLYVDLGERRPGRVSLGGGQGGVVADELAMFEGVLPYRTLYEVSRPPGKNVTAMRRLLEEAADPSAIPPYAQWRMAWRESVRAGEVWEAEEGQSDTLVVRGEAATTASGQAFVVPQKEPLNISFRITEPGPVHLALRYALDRCVDLQWPIRHPESRTAWSRNETMMEVALDGRPLGTVRLFPTGTPNGHRGDVEPWVWIALAEGVMMSAGSHQLTLTEKEGLASPCVDALLVRRRALPPAPAFLRWVDRYRIPPAWWVASKQTDLQKGVRSDTYTVTLYNRGDEPWSGTITLEYDRMGKGQSASVSPPRLKLAPHEEKAISIVFETPQTTADSSGYLRVVLWNDETGWPMEYRLWNFVPRWAFAAQQHPSLIPPPDPERQARFRAWLAKRDPAKLTPDLRAWAAGPDRTLAAPEYKALEGGAKVRLRMFEKPLLEQRLAMLDFWMDMTPEQFDAWLPDASSENHGYGSTWDRVNNALTGAWYGPTRILALDPPMDLVLPGGDLDFVKAVTVVGRDDHAFRARKEVIEQTGTWTRVETPDVFLSLRLVRWAMAFGMGNLDVAVEYPREGGIGVLAEATYLTGDPRYIRHAAELAKVLARKYTRRTKQYGPRLHREDRDWWGSRLGNRYLYDTAVGALTMLGTVLLDLGWNDLDAPTRDCLEHNLVRWGMFEASNGPLWDDPDKFAKVNREDMPPFIAFARVVGDPGPYEGLQDYFRRLNGMVLTDGLHICSIGSYGGVSAYLAFLKRLHALGVDVVTNNEALRNAFLNHVRFTFACGSVQPMDDGGGGQNLLGLGPIFGAPSAEQYEWGYTLFEDPLFHVMPDFLTAMARATEGDGLKRVENMRAFYTASPFPLRTIWPPVFDAPVKGMAMLRNWSASDPLDWIEVLVDYGRFGGRFHGHPNKLSILTAYNGQVGSCDHGDSLRNAPENNNEWTRGGYSHNTVQVDFRPHRSYSVDIPVGERLDIGGDEQLQWADVASRRMYPDVFLRRTTFVTDAGIVDFTLCRSDNEHVYDWPYHNFGKASTETPLSPVDVSSQGLLCFVRQARAGKNDGLVQVVWKNEPLSRRPPLKGESSLIGETVFARLWALPERGTDLLLFAGPAPAGLNEEREIDYAMLRRKTTSTVFACVIEPWRASTGPKIVHVERAAVTEGGRILSDIEAMALRMRRSDGRQQIFFVNYRGGPKQVGPYATSAPLAVWVAEADGSVRQRWEGKGRTP